MTRPSPQSPLLVFIGNGSRSHAVKSNDPSKTMCGRSLVGKVVDEAWSGQPGCNTCFSLIAGGAS